MSVSDLIRDLEEKCPSANPVSRWETLLPLARQNELSKQDLRLLHDRCFDDWDVKNQGPAPVCVPSDSDIRSTNLFAWLQANGFSSAAEFHQWSCQSRAQFWQEAVERLDIHFSTPCDEVLDLSQGISKAAWFSGAKLNIANSCFSGPDDSVAIIVQRPGGRIRTWSVAELRGRASQVANSLVDAGYKVGDAIGVFMPMTDWSVAIYLGIVMAGCHVVSIADSFAAPEIATRLEISDAKAVFTYDHQVRSGKSLPLYRRLVEATDIRAIVLSFGDVLEIDLRQQDRDWTEFLVDRQEFEPVVCSVQETINVLFSSGTTGQPKAIPWNHLTPIKCAIDGYCHQDIREGDVCAWPTNLGWMMGPWLIFASLINKATIALYEDAPMGAGFGRFVQDAKVTMLGVVPTIVKAWQNSKEMEPLDWSAIRTFSSTGESSQPETMTYLSSLAEFKPVIEYCGGTEIGGGYVTSFPTLTNIPAAFNTPAVAIDFVLIESSDDSPELASDEGEVFLVPPSIGLSNRLINRDHEQTYFANTPEIEGCPQLRRHGDHFRRLETDQGRIFVAGGRVDDTMNLGGIKVSSAEIERVLNDVEGVLETAAVADVSGSGPAQLKVFTVLENNLSNEIDPAKLHRDMNRRIKQQLNPLFRVGSVEVVSALPRTASGKVMRRKLRS